MEKHKKDHVTIINLKHLLQHGMMNLNHQIDRVLYQVFKIIFENILQITWNNIDDLSIRIYVNQIENRITLKIKTGYYLELLTPETMKLLESTENKITKDKNSESAPHLEITEVVLVHCNIVNNHYQQDLKDSYTFVPNKTFGDSLLEISSKNLIQISRN